MKAFATSEIRNVVLIGQKGCGKTSLAEAMLYTGKMVTRLGRVEDGNAILDFEPEEHKRVASVQSATAYLEWQKQKINVIDVPGDPTFFADAQNCIQVVEGALVVVDAIDGVQPHTTKLFKKADGLARCIVISKLCRERANFETTVEAVKERLDSGAAVVTMPIGSEEAFKGVVDLLDFKAHMYTAGSQDKPTVADVPADMLDEAKVARDALIEEIAGSDEALMEKYLDSGELTEAEARQGLKAAVAAGTLCPVYAVDSTHNIGVRELLDGVAGAFPSPDGVGPAKGVQGADGAEVDLPHTVDGPFVGVVFKTLVDQHAGKISVFKVLSGKATKDTAVHNVNRDSGERFGSLIQLQGKKVDHVEEASMGDIVAVAKLKETHTGDTLCTGNTKVRASMPEASPPQIAYRIIPKNKGDEDKISQSLHRLLDEDPTLVIGHDEMTKEITLAGYGVAHIDVALEKMARKYHVDVNRAPPLVAYRETVTKPVTNVEGKHKKQSGGRGQFGVCFIDVRPRARGEGYKFIDSIFGGAIPRQYIPAVDKGIQECLARGVLAGYPVVDVEIELKDGKYHDVDSSEMAFKIAGSKGFQGAAKKAGIQILEPVMDVEVEVPEEFMGDVMGDINSRRGRVMGMDTQSGVSTVKAQVPQAEMLTYAPDLKSMTQGRGVFTMHFSHYDFLPTSLQDKIIAESPNKPAGTDED